MYFPYPKSRSTSNGWCGTATIGGAQFARSRLRTASPASGRPDVGNTPNGPLGPRHGLDKQRLGQLINLVSDIGLGSPADRARDILGRVYEYFLSQFAGAEGKNGASSIRRPTLCGCWSRCRRSIARFQREYPALDTAQLSPGALPDA